jgi:formamidopyrimidine-DNA glycosylase
MIELPEAVVLARQIRENLIGKRVSGVIVSRAPHKFAFYAGDPEKYADKLIGKTIQKAESRGGLLEISLEDTRLVFGDGANLRFHAIGEPEPAKHQLLISFSDLTAFSVSVQMYGGIYCFNEGMFDNQYYKIAGEKPSPLLARFNQDYFAKLVADPRLQKLSLKAVLATEQRIPGLGNGVLQDILFGSSLHPKKKASSLSESELESLFYTIKSSLSEMVSLGGRDTEKDLFGRSGGYITRMSKNNLDNPCPNCGGKITKEAYLGGSVYYCSNCQRL